MAKFPQKYKNSAGEVVPSVTSLLGNLGWSGFGLKWWAFEEGKKVGKANQMELTINDIAEKLADAGTLCHAFAQADITGKPREPIGEDVEPSIVQKAEDNFKAYLAWKDRTRLELIASEVRLVSEKLRYGGRLDAIAVFDGAPGILDFKSSKELYPDTVVQVAAYAHAWNEVHPDMLVTHWHVLRWNPDGGFAHHALSTGQVEAGWRAFECCMKLHALKKEIGGRP